ncbi:MAG: hypothetical protein CMA63_04160 [Euryarchaeota archaeon]|nr:hypothetical protein [Euryarchaeota archaeon]|tara:strand:+ start:6218 stop:7225 length:1008 start_codon:yes stop_codon:yes gene_type:complete
MALIFSRIKSAPAEGLLILTTLVTLVYSVNFMFASGCYVTGGEGCFTLLSNNTTPSDAAFGKGAPEFAFNGILMFGILMSTLLILNEGAKGKWTIMLPTLIGFIVGSIVLWAMWEDNGSSEMPKFVTPVITLIYAAAYYFLMAEDEVNDGLSEFKVGLGVKDPVAIVGLLFVIATGLFYVVRQIINPESVIEAVTAGELSDGLGAPSKVTVAFSGALLLVYVLWAALILMKGAKGMWPVAHPPLFAFLTVTVANYFGFVFGPLRVFSEQNQMDALAGPMTMLVFLLVYFRLRPEGIEDGMTMQGEPADAKNFDVMFTIVTIAICAAFFAVNMIRG